MPTSKRYCSSCKRPSEWPTKHKTCPSCRAKVAKSDHLKKEGGADRSGMRSNAMEKEFTLEKALELVEQAEAGVRDAQLAMYLKLTPAIFQRWRDRGAKSVNPRDPFFMLYYDVNAVRVKRFAEILTKWRDSSNFRAQLAWMEWTFPEQKPPRSPSQLTPKKPAETDPEDTPLKELQFV